MLGIRREEDGLRSLKLTESGALESLARSSGLDLVFVFAEFGGDQFFEGLAGFRFAC